MICKSKSNTTLTHTHIHPYEHWYKIIVNQFYDLFYTLVRYVGDLTFHVILTRTSDVLIKILSSSLVRKYRFSFSFLCNKKKIVGQMHTSKKEREWPRGTF